jgi:peroxiredoxin/uncharacterized protein (DUF4415 family)
MSMSKSLIKKNSFFLMCILIMVSTISTAQVLPVSNKFIVCGTLKGRDTGWVYFLNAETKDFKKVDSTKLSGGKFEFKGETAYPIPYQLGTNGVVKGKLMKFKIFSGLIIIDTGRLYLTGHADSLRNLKAWGTLAQEEYNAFMTRMNPLFRRSNDLFETGFKIKKNDKRRLDSVEKLKKQATIRIEQAIADHVKQYRSQVSAYLVTEHMALANGASLEPLYMMLPTAVQQSHFGLKFAKRLNTSLMTDIGKIAPTFTLPNETGKLVSLESYRGKFLLIDFWASWCGPCRAENPNLLKAYQSYHDKGFEILSISMDKDSTNWLKAIKEDRLPWTQVSDLKANDSLLTTLYGIKIIPLNFLLDKEGKIIARNLRGPDLEKVLASLKIGQ